MGARAGKDVLPPIDLPLIDVAPLIEGFEGSGPPSGGAMNAAAEIDRACREHGFFRIVGHGVAPDLLATMEALAREFFARPAAEKEQVAMARAGSAWRGWFPVGGELTSGRPDRKEGMYVGLEHGPGHPRVASGTALHGSNLFPEEPAELGPVVIAWIEAVTPVAHAVMQGIALGLGLPVTWFGDHLIGDPTILFRIFHYPPGGVDAPADWGVGEHTDYGLLTVLAQDDSGGLQVRSLDRWVDVPADPAVLVCNIGDMLDRLTEGRYRSTPHRVRNVTRRSRLSFPFFLDPSWDAVVTPLPLDGTPPADADEDAGRRWDSTSVQLWEGAYGEYLTSKVSRVFPELFASLGEGS